MSLRLYDYPASANCYKVRLLLAQLGRPYDRVLVDIFAGETLSDDYAAINPARETPVLQVGDLYLPESGAILAFLAEGTELMPADALGRSQVLRWLLFEQTGVMTPIGGLRFRLITGRISAESAERRRQAALASLALLEGHLAHHDFFAGSRYSIADIAIYGYAHVAGEAGIDLAGFPAVRAWCERVSAQPGHMNDLEPYPANARAGAGRSIYG
jgi:glutathione S-transferase